LTCIHVLRVEPRVQVPAEKCFDVENKGNLVYRQC
jgi:hypothetical protein